MANEYPEIVGFFSYSRRDDEHSMGSLSRLRAHIQSELRLQMGRDFRLWQDTSAIPEGALWENEIRKAISEALFFIPIVTPSAVTSTHCSIEFEAFLKREAELGRNDLIFPILYITVEELENEREWRQHDLLKIIGSRQYLDWRKYRHQDPAAPVVAQQIEQFCSNIYRALRRQPLTEAGRKARSDAEDRLRIEEQERSKKREEADARAKAQDEQRRKKELAEAQRRAADEERRKKLEAQSRARAEEARRAQEADAKAKLHAAQEKAFTAAKLAASVGALDEFLADHPGSDFENEAQALRDVLFAREQVAVPKTADLAPPGALLDAHPERSFADRTPSALPRWRASPPVAAIALIGGAILIFAGAVWWLMARPSVQPAATDGVPLTAAREQALKAKDSFKECANCPVMVVAPAGNFTMGSPASEPGRNGDESPVHVTIAQPLAIGKYAVTFDEWEACAADGGCNGYAPPDAGWGRGRRPVINVSWQDAKAYVVWLSNKTGKTYRLLSEAEREYVTRAGTTSPFWFGGSITPAQANYNSAYVYQGGGTKGDYRAQTVAVDTFMPNPWGLYQLHGNIWEWTEDCWNDSNVGNPGDGTARKSGDCNRQVVRGGSWYNSPAFLRSASRGSYPSANRNDGFGFRIARTISP